MFSLYLSLLRFTRLLYLSSYLFIHFSFTFFSFYHSGKSFLNNLLFHYFAFLSTFLLRCLSFRVTLSLLTTPELIQISPHSIIRCLIPYCLTLFTLSSITLSLCIDLTHCYTIYIVHVSLPSLITLSAAIKSELLHLLVPLSSYQHTWSLWLTGSSRPPRPSTPLSTAPPRSRKFRPFCYPYLCWWPLCCIYALESLSFTLPVFTTNFTCLTTWP